MVSNSTTGTKDSVVILAPFGAASVPIIAHSE